MEDREFFDHLYQLWSKTTGADGMFWMPERHEAKGRGPMGVFYIQAVNEQQETKRIASYLSDEDADFITAIHGCFADLVRRLHNALDEAERADYDKDSRECRIAELELELMEKE
jgi:hypothetical protein